MVSPEQWKQTPEISFLILVGLVRDSSDYHIPQYMKASIIPYNPQPTVVCFTLLKLMLVYFGLFKYGSK